MVYGTMTRNSKHGTLAQYRAVSKEMLALMPYRTRFDDTISISVAGATASSGGTGIWGIQIAKILECQVTASYSMANLTLCKDLGADDVLDYKSVDVTKMITEKGANTNFSSFKQVVENTLLPGFFGGGKRKYAFISVNAEAKDFAQLGNRVSEGRIRLASEKLKMGQGKEKTVVYVKNV
ncbi:hypothetical protein CC78DRAFT_558951 [Lojkania enalia]|uniref:Alcohol dehydrogenase-like C-terminal domain-containing protein n=1 Tax=Lojkania enalia TaxID=147567 RepID=A0A9P4KDR6_9PLEO|nr:hypothetical protein CC78DRAFT_558951 [Didymosphaeria enalia]